MLILLFFAFIAGLVTIAAPCIWPLLPLVLSATVSGGQRRPLGIVLGIGISFTLFTLGLSYLVKSLPIDPNMFRTLAVIIIGFLGLSLIIPSLSTWLEALVGRLVGRLAGRFTQGRKANAGFTGGLVTGLSLGIVWSPCAGPILATIATLAATRSLNFQTILLTVVYVLGICLPLLLFAVAGQRLLINARWLSGSTGLIQRIFGLVMILAALAIYTNYDKTLEASLLSHFPSYTNFINQIESNRLTKPQLDRLRGQTPTPTTKPTASPTAASSLKDYGPAPDFAGITDWLNREKPLTLADLKGKVVLIDFFTYTCINCVRSLPFITSWYDKYHDKGFVVVGVHTPEFEFEKNTDNVAAAIKQRGIHYPVAQDNDYATWRAYNNEYWPAEYLIDAKGHIRHIHFGEGEYNQTEAAIRTLLKEAGHNPDAPMTDLPDPTPKTPTTPETYVGLKRLERFGSHEKVNGGGAQTFTIDRPLDLRSLAFEGQWDVQSEFATASAGSALEFHWQSSKVFVVLTPKNPADKIKVLLDGKPVDSTNAGQAIDNGEVNLSSPQPYEIINLKDKSDDHTLRLEFQTDGAQVYAFTFG